MTERAAQPAAGSGRDAARPTVAAVPIALIRAREAVMTHFRPLLAERGYTEQQWRVLRVLDEFGPVDPTQLAQRSALLMPSLTRILKTLEERGDVERGGDPSDGRRSLVRVTAKARATIAQAAASTEAAYAQIERQFGAAKMATLLQLLDELARIEPPAGGG